MSCDTSYEGNWWKATCYFNGCWSVLCLCKGELPTCVHNKLNQNLVKFMNSLDVNCECCELKYMSCKLQVVFAISNFNPQILTRKSPIKFMMIWFESFEVIIQMVKSTWIMVLQICFVWFFSINDYENKLTTILGLIKEGNWWKATCYFNGCSLLCLYEVNYITYLFNKLNQRLQGSSLCRVWMCELQVASKLTCMSKFVVQGNSHTLNSQNTFIQVHDTVKVEIFAGHLFSR